MLSILLHLAAAIVAVLYARRELDYARQDRNGGDA